MDKKPKEATPEELLEAAIRFYTQYADRPKEMEHLLRLGFALAQPDGWSYVAPAWLGELRQPLDVPYRLRYSSGGCDDG